MNLHLSRRSPIGLDLGTRQVKAVQLSGSATNPRISASLSITRPDHTDDATWYRKLDSLMTLRGFHGRSCVLAAPIEHLHSSIVELPSASDPVAAEQAARMALSRLHRIEPTGFEYALHRAEPAEGAKGRKQIMSYVLEHAHADKLIESMTQAGFDTQRIEVPALALATTLVNDNTERGLTLLVDLGWSACRVIACLSGSVVYERTIEPAGLETLFATVAETAGQPFATVHELLKQTQSSETPTQDDPTLTKAIRQYAGLVTEETAVCKNYVSRLGSQDDRPRIILTGGGARYPQVAEHLARTIEADISQNTNDPQPGTELAFALAASGWRAAA
ncbi:MAG: hypothetical protein RIG82_06320 [Phycisphaeraceae bacterium]